MRKLEDREIKWIIKVLEKGKRTQKQIAELKNVSQARISQLWNEYKETGDISGITFLISRENCKFSSRNTEAKGGW